MSSLKLLRVITSMSPKSGGPCHGIRNINPYLKQLGIEVEVICMDEITDDYFTTDDFVIHKLGKGRSRYQYQPLLYYWLVKNASQFDCIIVHGLWQHYNLAVYHAVRQLKKRHRKVPKVAIMPHGMLDPYFQTAPDRKLKALRNEFIWHFFEKKCINEADAIFYTCHEELRLAGATFEGYNPKKSINVNYGIQTPPKRESEMDNAFFKKCSKLSGEEYWLFLGRIHEKKGIDLLIKAYCKFASLNSSLPALVIAGPIDCSYARDMISLASGNSKIYFLGMLQGKEKWGAYYNCQAFFLPSHQENFGIAIVEAMACEKPVLITKKVNIYKEIEDGGGGLVFNDTYDGILQVMKKWEKLSKIEKIEMGNNAFILYQNSYNIKSASERLDGVLRSII